MERTCSGRQCRYVMSKSYTAILRGGRSIRWRKVRMTTRPLTVTAALLGGGGASVFERRSFNGRPYRYFRRRSVGLYRTACRLLFGRLCGRLSITTMMMRIRGRTAGVISSQRLSSRAASLSVEMRPASLTIQYTDLSNNRQL